MSDIVFNDKPTTTFWIVGGAALIWNLIGLVFYIGHVTISPEALAAMPQLQQDFFAETPTWATAAFALAANAGVLGSLFLLLRKAWAVPSYFVTGSALSASTASSFHR